MTSAQENKSSPKISLSAVEKRFGPTLALTDVTAHIPADQKTVLIGPAASGKTVLMKCIAGLYMPEAGHIEIDGEPVARAGTRSHTKMMQSVGVLFQQGGLFDSMPVWKNVSFKLIQTRGVDDETARATAIEKLAMVNLPAGTADLLPAELSGGMQKRVGIARALADDPKLLLLDEPTAGLDPITTTAINRLIETSRRDLGATVLSITSDMDAARTHYDHLLMLNEGQLVWSGATAEIERSDNPYLRQMIEGKAQGPISTPGAQARTERNLPADSEA